MSNETNKAVVMRYYVEFMDQQNVDVAKEIMSPDWVNHDPDMPTLKGVEGAIELYKMVRIPLPDSKLTIHHILAEGDLVAVNATGHGMNNLPLLGLPATGKRVTFKLMALHRVLDGKITDTWVVSDLVSQLQQLGAVSTPAN